MTRSGWQWGIDSMSPSEAQKHLPRPVFPQARQALTEKVMERRRVEGE